MTPEEAKVILSAHRAGQPDAEDAALREALDLAAAQPELAAWWENEQAFDRAFAKKLTEIPVPLELHDAIMRGGTTIFAARKLIADSTTAETDEAAPADAPESESERKIVQFYGDAAARRQTAAPPAWRQWAMPATLAASLGLALIGVSLFFAPRPAAAQPELPQFSNYAATVLVDGKVAAQHVTDRLDEMQEFLRQDQAPVPERLPAPLEGARLLGCGVQHWHSHPVAVVRLHDGTTVLHLFIARRDAFPNDTVGPQREKADVGKFGIYTWSDGGHVYILVDDETTPEQ